MKTLTFSFMLLLLLQPLLYSEDYFDDQNIVTIVMLQLEMDK